MKKLLLLLAALLFILPAMSQSSKQTRIEGRIHDKITMNWLYSATIKCIRVTDSSTIAIRLTDNNGRFSLDSLPSDNYLLTISYIGYNSLTISVAKSQDKHVINIENIALQKKNIDLSQIEIIQSANPVTIKKDTLEFSASYFKPKSDDLVEDLLRKIPSIQIDNNGSISFNGKVIKYILINGRPIFNGDDLKNVSQSILAKIVDKIQVIDSDIDETGSTRNSNEKIKTINITTKKNLQGKVNGQLSAAIGTKDRFDLKANLNKFKKDEQIILVGSGENIDGAADALPVQNNGIEQKWKSGINYNKDINKRTTINISYLMQKKDSKIEQKNSRLTFVGDTGYLNNQSSQLEENTISHRLNAQIKYQLDSSTILTISNLLNINKEHKTQQNQYESTGIDSNQLTSGSVLNTDMIKKKSISSGLTVEKKFNKKGRSLNAFIGYAAGSPNSAENNQSHNSIHNSDNEPTIDTINLLSNEHGKDQSLYLNINYSEPISKRGSMLFAYGEEHIRQLSDKYTFGFNKTTNSFDILNDSLSSSFKYSYDQRYAKIGWTSQLGKWGYTISIAQIISVINNINKFTMEKIKIGASGTIPFLRVNYDFTNSKNILFTYYRSVQFPGINETQPVIDYKDPMYIRKGNPQLKPSWTENISLSYNLFNPSNLSSFFVLLYGTVVKDQISNGISLDTLGRQVIQPLNLSGAFKTGINISGNIPLKKKPNAISLNTSAIFSKNMNYINGTKGNYKNVSIDQQIGYSYNFKEILEVIARGNINYEFTQYHSTYASNTWNTRYNLSLENKLNTIAGISISSTITCGWINGNIKDYNVRNTQLNFSISKKLFSQQQGSIKLQVYDLLNQNIQINRTVGSNYIENSEINVLNRFFLLKFSYLIM